MKKSLKSASIATILAICATLAVTAPASAGNPCASQIQNNFVSSYVKYKDPAGGCAELTFTMEYDAVYGPISYSQTTRTNLAAGVTYTGPARVQLIRTAACTGVLCGYSSGWISSSLWYTFG